MLYILLDAQTWALTKDADHILVCRIVVDNQQHTGQWYTKTSRKETSTESWMRTALALTHS